MKAVCGLRMLCIPAVVAAALTVGSGVAAADDDGYLGQLKKIGVVWQPGGEGTLISLGHAICSDRAAGKTPDELATDVHSGLSSSFNYGGRHGDRQRSGIQLLPLTTPEASS